MQLQYTEYYEEFLRYFEMASWQHENCNLGTRPHSEMPYDDDLMKNVFLYDVVERKYAGFGQILLDVMCDKNNHPYKHKMPKWREDICNGIDSSSWDLPEFLFVFFVHRLTGSAINYSKNPSGYHNSPLLHMSGCTSIRDMVKAYKNIKGPKFTSMGYQIASFPKPKGFYSRGGDYFICEHLPKLCYHLSNWLEINSSPASFREVVNECKKFNDKRNFRMWWFQYSAAAADIADFFPHLVKPDSLFLYGKNAEECMSYMAEKPRGMSKLEFLDEIAMKILKDTGSVPYNSEDICCDFIRWIESYINPKQDYSHLDLDQIFSSHTIHSHPYGRQQMMLDLGIVDSFNGMSHPSDDKILKDRKISVQDYKNRANSYYESLLIEFHDEDEEHFYDF